MGSYGIGVERAIAAIAEVHHDDVGLTWPVQMAPFEVAVLPLSGKDAEVKATAEMLYGSLLDEGVEAVIDDRDVRPGVKYADVELIGIPFRISVGARDLADGVVEITSRVTGEKVTSTGRPGRHAPAGTASSLAHRRANPALASTDRVLARGLQSDDVVLAVIVDRCPVRGMNSRSCLLSSAAQRCLLSQFFVSVVLLADMVPPRDKPNAQAQADCPLAGRFTASHRWP